MNATLASLKGSINCRNFMRPMTIQKNNPNILIRTC